MIGILETCKCGRKFLRGIYPQEKCEMCNVTKGSLKFWTLVALLLENDMPPDEPKPTGIPNHPLG